MRNQRGLGHESKPKIVAEKVAPVGEDVAGMSTAKERSQTYLRP